MLQVLNGSVWQSSRTLAVGLGGQRQIVFALTETFSDNHLAGKYSTEMGSSSQNSATTNPVERDMLLRSPLVVN